MKSTTALSMVRVFRAMQYSEQGLRSAWRDEAAFRQELVLVMFLVQAQGLIKLKASLSSCVLTLGFLPEPRWCMSIPTQQRLLEN